MLFISVEHEQVGIVRHAWWLASLEATVTAMCIFCTVKLLYIELLVYEHSVQTLF